MLRVSKDRGILHMKLRAKTILGISMLALSGMFIGRAEARSVAPSECSVAGILTAGGMLEGGHFSSSSGGSTLDSAWGALFGEGAGLVTCDAWNFQGDVAYYNHTAIARGKSFNAPEGHFGGDIFWRDPSVGDFGFQASYLSQTSIFNTFDGNFDIARGGLFGNYYLNDRVSLGANAHLFTTTHNVFRSKGSSGKGYSGFEVSADAKYYVTPNLKFTLTGDFLQSQYNAPSFSTIPKLGGAAVTLQADYQFCDTGLTGFIGGRFAHRVFWTDSSSSTTNIDERQVFIGLTLPIGAKPGSMVMHDRTGPVNNTSTFLEKLPEPTGDEFMAILQK